MEMTSPLTPPPPPPPPPPHTHTHTHTEKDFIQARQHFLYVEMPEEFGVLLMAVATSEGYPGEADLFIAQAVLQ